MPASLLVCGWEFDLFPCPSPPPPRPKYLWPLKEASPWESLLGLCRCRHQKNQLSLQAWGEGCLVEVCWEGGGGSYLRLGGGG